MAVGIKLAYGMLGLMLALSMAAGAGVPDALGMSVSDHYADDVNDVVDAMTDQKQPNTGESTFADFTIGGGRALQTLWQVVTNTDAVLILLTGMPRSLATGIQTFVVIVFGVTFAQFIRGVLIE